MAGWAGFTEEDLRKMRQTSPERGRGSGNKRQISQNRKPKLQNREKLIGTQQLGNQGIQELTSNQRLSKPKSPPILPNNQDKQHENMASKTQEIQKEGTKPTDETKPEPEKDLESRELDDEEAKNVELSNMERFQKQQKMIEEANKQKKALLAKTINERRLKAKAESAKLTKIQKELNHLDSLLTADVSVIRDKIELASMEFLDAQKRYDKAEKEVIAAKMNLFEKGELKERLTEHLYTIIHQNEVRKSKKLAELMEILEMETSAEELESLQATSIPALTNFNSVQTLTSPTRKTSESDNEKIDREKSLEAGTNSESQNKTEQTVGENLEQKSVTSEGIKTDSIGDSSVESNAKDNIETSSKGDNVTSAAILQSDNNTKIVNNNTEKITTQPINESTACVS